MVGQVQSRQIRQKYGVYFDLRDGEILGLVNRVLEGRSEALGDQSDTNLHPHGIKELVDTPAARMALAVVNLLNNQEAGRSQARDRLMGLRILYDEVINSASTALRRNTARVLMQVMKGIVRAHGNEEHQLKLAHDFRAAAQGTPRIVRRLLRRYDLPEMPEAWNQVAFDDHVYDMNTKGRKSPTHLVMDAWIRGLRSLTIVYDNCVDPNVAQEVLSAASIVGISVRIGIEFKVPFRGRFVKFLWIPRGFLSDQDFLDFLKSPKMARLIALGRDVVAFTRDMVLKELDLWNDAVRPGCARTYGVDIPPVSADDFLNYVGQGHANKERLAEFLYTMLQPRIDRIIEGLALKPESSLSEEERRRKGLLEALCSDVIQDEWLNESVHEELPRIVLPDDMESLPPLMALTPMGLMKELQSVTASYRVSLGTRSLGVQDVMELLWDCKGTISHLEIFSMRGWTEGSMTSIHEIGELQTALNSGQGPRLKQMIRQMIRDIREAGDEERAAKFEGILSNVPTLWERYRHVPLKSRVGTGSSNRTHSFGMGLVVADTLPRRTARFFKDPKAGYSLIPVCAPLEQRVIYREPESPGVWESFLRSLRRLPLCSKLGMEKRVEWSAPRERMRVCEKGNVANLDGPSNFRLAMEEKKSGRGPGPRYLNSRLTNILKVLAGFIPAFLSFLYTQDIWFLAWFGSLIWFSITGVRNVVQMVLAAKGLNRSSLIHWRSQVSINRLCDSLMYTGVSVFLLELTMRVLILQNTLHITAATNPVLVFACLSCLNGMYICCHNIYRGFPKSAAIGNLFRSILAIPLAAFYNAALWQLCLFLGVADPAFYLAPSAAVISKSASDTIAAVIEGFADSRNNRRKRNMDYKSKLRGIFDCYTHLELLFPKEDALARLARPGGLKGRGGAEALKLERSFIINALDMMYFWFYQPRAQEACRQMVRTLSSADRTVLALSQLVLLREREISQLMVDGLVGRDFARPLAFFLNKRKEYIKAMVHLCKPGRTVTMRTHKAVFGAAGQSPS